MRPPSSTVPHYGSISAAVPPEDEPSELASTEESDGDKPAGLIPDGLDFGAGI